MNFPTHKHFTQSEANQALGYVSKITQDIVQKWNYILSLSDEEREVHLQMLQDGNDPRMLMDAKLIIEDIKYHTKELLNVGCTIKDLGKGIVLFPTRLHGKEGYFVWQYGEQVVEKVYEKVESKKMAMTKL